MEIVETEGDTFFFFFKREILNKNEHQISWHTPSSQGTLLEVLFCLGSQIQTTPNLLSPPFSFFKPFFFFNL